VKAEELRAVVLRALASVAPEADLAAIDADGAFRDQLDLDSMDFLNFVIALHAATGVDVPEADYARLATLRGCEAYLAEKIRQPTRT
jgi:acyl carrier protein